VRFLANLWHARAGLDRFELACRADQPAGAPKQRARAAGPSAALPGIILALGMRIYVRISATTGRSTVRPTLHLTATVTRDPDKFLARCLEVGGLAARGTSVQDALAALTELAPASLPTSNLPIPTRARHHPGHRPVGLAAEHRAAEPAAPASTVAQAARPGCLLWEPPVLRRP
jgi:hypothetical protein